MVVGFWSLIEFCKEFGQYRNMASSLAMANPAKRTARSSHKRQPNNALSRPSTSSSSSLLALCDKSSSSSVDIFILVIVLCACSFLFTPYFKYLYTEAMEVLLFTLIVLGDFVYKVPIVYISGALLMFALVVGSCELYLYKARKCDNPKCRGLRKAVQFDIHLESERCVKSLTSSSLKSLPSPSPSSFSHEVPSWKGSVELGHDHKELEAELKKMAPPNGRAVLVFRSPCGCLAARMEVWGTRKPHKVKK